MNFNKICREGEIFGAEIGKSSEMVTNRTERFQKAHVFWRDDFASVTVHVSFIYFSKQMWVHLHVTLAKHLHWIIWLLLMDWEKKIYRGFRPEVPQIMTLLQTVYKKKS